MSTLDNAPETAPDLGPEPVGTLMAPDEFDAVDACIEEWANIWGAPGPHAGPDRGGEIRRSGEPLGAPIGLAGITPGRDDGSRGPNGGPR